ncbi:MAG: hypothetical protein PHS92_03230 [Candidatus Gracilibacteria bacterium]|nr:hypothetical protein [Candidatus Gracilibacteria bacterium]
MLKIYISEVRDSAKTLDEFNISFKDNDMFWCHHCKRIYFYANIYLNEGKCLTCERYKFVPLSLFSFLNNFPDKPKEGDKYVPK